MTELRPIQTNQLPKKEIPSAVKQGMLSSDLVKSKKRVADHGEVFTPSWLVERMLNLVEDDANRIDSRFLEPACGSGNFLSAVLAKKLESVQKRYGKSPFELRSYSLFAIMCIYGIEILEDNVQECRENLFNQFQRTMKVDPEDVLMKAVRRVLELNIIHGDALTITNINGKPIEFPEWGYLGKGKYQRRDFRYELLTQRSGIEGTLFEAFEEHQLFSPSNTYPIMNIDEIANE